MRYTMLPIGKDCQPVRWLGWHFKHGKKAACMTEDSLSQSLQSPLCKRLGASAPEHSVHAQGQSPGKTWCPVSGRCASHC